jgi:hypothetical protein
MAWVTQGDITDRTAEHIGKSDIGVIMLRRMFREQMALVEAGQDPTVAFTREKHDRIGLPCEKDKFGVNFLEFALAWLEMGSSKYSPELDTIKKLHIAAASIRGDMPGQADDGERPASEARSPAVPMTTRTTSSRRTPSGAGGSRVPLVGPGPSPTSTTCLATARRAATHRRGRRHRRRVLGRRRAGLSHLVPRLRLGGRHHPRSADDRDTKPSTESAPTMRQSSGRNRGATTDYGQRAVERFRKRRCEWRLQCFRSPSEGALGALRNRTLALVVILL